MSRAGGFRTVVLGRPRRGDSSRKSEKEESVNFESEDHANWMRCASRISVGERPAGRGVERSFAGWFGSADVGAKAGGWRCVGELE
jgi:hypothetical protein